MYQIKFLSQIILDGNSRLLEVTGSSAPVNDNPGFETIEALLQHYSPLYNDRRTELLVAKLSG